MSAPAPAARNAVGTGRDRVALTQTLRTDVTRYLAARKRIDHISAVELEVSFPGHEPGIDIAAGTTKYDGNVPVRPGALWQIGSITKAFTSALLLQLEAAGKLSIHDPLAKWLPQYPAWRHITIQHLLNMTSGIPDYTEQPAFLNTLGSAPGRVFSAAQLVSYVEKLPVGKASFHYSNTNYILAQMIIERAGHDTYAHQLARRITGPLGLRSTCFAPYTCPADAASRLPAGYFVSPAPAALAGRPVPPLALTGAQGAGGIVASLSDLATWDRALYNGALLPSGQQRELETLVYPLTSKPLPVTTATSPLGYGLGVIQADYSPIGLFWTYEGGTFGYRVWHVYDPGTGVAIALGLNSTAASPYGNLYSGPDQDTEDQLGFTVYRALEHYGAIPSGR